MSKSDGGPAYPQGQVDFGNGLEDPAPFGMGGMSLRDYFAGQALAGITSADQKPSGCLPADEVIAKAAYILADAMLAEREKA